MGSSNKFKILAFDPGLTNLGYSLLEGSTSDGDLVVLKIGEIHPGPTVDRVAYKDDVEKFDKRTISLAYMREQVGLLIDKHKPDFICAEDIYINIHRPQAYGALCMVICVMRMFCRDYANKYLVTIPTKICKRETCGSGGGGKIGVQEALVNHKHIKFANEFDMMHMTEHQADSIAVGYAFSTTYRELINKEIENGRGK